MYNSKPKEREGEPLELVVPEAITVTSSKEGEGGAQEASALPDWMPEGKAAFAAAAVIALLEALVIVLMVAI